MPLEDINIFCPDVSSYKNYDSILITLVKKHPIFKNYRLGSYADRNFYI